MPLFYFSENGIAASDPIKVVNKFNDYFTNIAQNRLNDLGKTNNLFQDLKKPK